MSDDSKNDPLDKIFSTEGLQDQRELLADTVFPYARINGETLEITFTQDGEALTAREKILVLLLLRKALFLRGIVSTEAIPPIEIEKMALGLTGGTIRPVLRRLESERLIKSAEGTYMVPNSRIKEINLLLMKKGGKA